MDLQTKRQLMARCVVEPLEPGDERYVDIDQVESGGTGPRGLSCTEEIASAIELSVGPPKVHFFSGLPGSGKSTELGNLADRLMRPDGAHLLVARIDAERLFDLNSDLDLPDLLLVLVFGAEEKLAEAAPKVRPDEGALSRLWDWIKRTELVTDGAELSGGAKAGLPGAVELSAGMKVAIDLKTQPTLRDRFRARVATEFNTFLAEVNGALRTLDDWAKDAGWQGLVIVVDSLEKLSGTSTNWEQVLNTAEVVFKRLDDGLDLPVPVVMTVPPALVLRLSLPTLVFMPMIKLWDRKSPANHHEAGFRVGIEMIRRRISDAHLQELLGAEHFEARRRQIIARSAGYPRELVRLLAKLISTPNAAARFEQVLSQFANNIVDLVTTDEAVQVAAQVCVDTDIKVPRELGPELDRLMSNNVILRYQNTEHWYDVHPAVREKPTVQRAIALLRAQRERVDAGKGA